MTDYYRLHLTKHRCTLSNGKGFKKVFCNSRMLYQNVLPYIQMENAKYTFTHYKNTICQWVEGSELNKILASYCG